MRKICSYGSVGVPVGNHRRYPEKLSIPVQGVSVIFLSAIISVLASFCLSLLFSLYRSECHHFQVNVGPENGVQLGMPQKADGMTFIIAVNLWQSS
jgi:hypothetical protein